MLILNDAEIAFMILKVFSKLEMFYPQFDEVHLQKTLQLTSYLMVKHRILNSKIGNKGQMPIFTHLIQDSTGSPISIITQEKEITGLER